MKYGFVKVASATPTIRVADCDYNAKQIIEIVTNAQSQGVKLIVFPELCITGYTCGDLFFQNTLISSAGKALIDIANATKSHDTLCVVGLPVMKNAKLYNCAAVIQSGRIIGIVPKTNLPNYSEFYEARTFAKADNKNSTVKIGDLEVDFGTNLLFRSNQQCDFVLAVEICEDLWVPCPPSIFHALAGATIIANPSGGNEVVGKEEYRRNLVKGQSGRLSCGYVYSCAGDGESTTDFVFSAHNIIAENGALLAETELFENNIVISEIDIQRLQYERMITNTFAVDDSEYKTIYFDQQLTQATITRKIAKMPFVPLNEDVLNLRCEKIITMQAHGLKKRIEHTGCARLVIGISGGLDSTLALIVCVKALELLQRPYSDILAVTMPCFGTTDRTKTNAEKLCEALCVALLEIDITDAVKQHFKDIGHNENQLDVTFENSQARERTQVLMDLANKNNGIVIGTGDLSELALGFTTYNGDHMSMYNVNSSIPKTIIKHLLLCYAKGSRSSLLSSVLEDICATPVSPELIPGKDGTIAQKTEDIVGPYLLHDFFLYYIIKFGFAPSKIYYLATITFVDEFSDDEILKWLKVFYKRFFSQQFKRSCLVDGVKVGTVALSPRTCWKMPSDASVQLWLNELNSL